MSTGHRRPFPNVSVGGEHLYLRSIPPCPSCDRLTRTRPWPFFGPGREQADDLGDTRRAEVRPAGRRIDVPQAGPAVELRQRAEAGPSGPVSRPCRSAVAGKPVARWAVRRQLHERSEAGRQARLPHPRRVPGARPSAVAGRDRHPSPAAMDRAADLRHGLWAPCLVRVKRNRANGVTAGIGRDLGAKPFTARGLIPPPRRPALHKRVPGWVPVPPVLSAEGNMSFRNAQPG